MTTNPNDAVMRALARDFYAAYSAAKGAEFDLVPSDGPIARLVLFVHKHGDAISAALATPSAQSGDAEVREALETYDATVKRCPANTQFLGDRKCPRCSAGPDEGCRQEIRAAGAVITAVRTSLATPSGRAQGEVE